MKRLLIPLLAAGSLLQAAPVTSGTLDIRTGENGFGALSLLGPGFQLTDNSQPLSSNWMAMSVTMCTGTCSFSFTGVVNGAAASSILNLNGTTYRLTSNQIISYALNITGTPLSATAVCVNCQPGQPPLRTTLWPTGTFTMTGTVTVRDGGTNQILITEAISGSGVTTADSYFDANVGPWNYAHTTYNFDTPEPASGRLLMIAAAGLRLRRRPHPPAIRLLVECMR